MAEQDSLKTSMAALALSLESAVAGVGDLPALAQIFAAATGGGENACGKARLGLCHGGKKGEMRYDCLPKPEERHEGSVRMHCLHNFWAPKVETATSAVETHQRDEDARRAAKGGDAGGRQLAAKGRGANKDMRQTCWERCRHAKCLAKR